MSFRLLLAVFSVVALGAASPFPGVPSSSPITPVRLSFVPNAALFSIATHQADLVDPDVFVAEQSAQAALGLAQIAHIQGERNARMSDDAGAQALDANARPLGFDLQHWFAANGVVQLAPPDLDRGGAQIVTLRFANLIARGRYSVFVVHFESQPATFAPLDGTGKTNSFTADADGTAGASVVALHTLPHGSAIVLVYHADRKDHGFKMGTPGLDAFHQSIARIP